MYINFIIIGSYDDNDSLEISSYKLYRDGSDSTLVYPDFNEGKKISFFF